MNNELELELKEHLYTYLNDNYSDDELNEYHDFSELHQKAFNEDYYMIGYYQAKEWLKKHDICPFDAIAECLDYELEMLGEICLKPEDINSEKIVNLYVYIKGEQLINELDCDIDDVSFTELKGLLK